MKKIHKWSIAILLSVIFSLIAAFISNYIYGYPIGDNHTVVSGDNSTVFSGNNPTVNIVNNNNGEKCEKLNGYFEKLLIYEDKNMHSTCTELLNKNNKLNNSDVLKGMASEVKPKKLTSEQIDKIVGGFGDYTKRKKIADKKCATGSLVEIKICRNNIMKTFRVFTEEDDIRMEKEGEEAAKKGMSMINVNFILATDKVGPNGEPSQAENILRKLKKIVLLCTEDIGCRINDNDFLSRQQVNKNNLREIRGKEFAYMLYKGGQVMEGEDFDEYNIRMSKIYLFSKNSLEPLITGPDLACRNNYCKATTDKKVNNGWIYIKGGELLPTETKQDYINKVRRENA